MKCDNMGRTLQLYFIDGRPDGMLTAEVFNWTGHVLMTPRTQFNTALAREEAERTGVYILLGERLAAQEEAREHQEGGIQAYIGRAENIRRRLAFSLAQAQMDWVESIVLVTSANNNLNAAHVTYLEARLIEEAHAAGFPLYNIANPARPGLSEADQANMEVFLDYLLMVLPALRIDMFPSRRCLDDCASAGSVQENGPEDGGPIVFELVAPQLGIRATAIQEENGGFVIQKDSQARLQWAGNNPMHIYAQQHARLVSSGVLRPDPEGNTLEFTKNWRFASTSAAASVVLGRPAAGPREWRVRGREQTYGEWQADQLGEPL